MSKPWTPSPLLVLVVVLLFTVGAAAVWEAFEDAECRRSCEFLSAEHRGRTSIGCFCRDGEDVFMLQERPWSYAD
jgi:hypothetical protein